MLRARWADEAALAQIQDGGDRRGHANAARSRWAARTQGRLEHAHGAVLDGPGGPGGLACCCDPGRFRSSAAVAVAGAAAAPSSRPRQAPAPSAPPRQPAHSGLRAIIISTPVKAQTIALCSSQASSGSASGCRSELGMSASSGQRNTVQVRRWPANELVRNSQQATERRPRGAARGHVGFAGCRRRVAGTTKRRHPKERDSRLGRCSVTSHPPMQPVEGGCRLAGRSDRCGVGSGRVPGHGPGGTRQPL
jgi:hypothetical protein